MNRRNRDDFTEKAMSPIVVNAVRKAMTDLGINASVGAIEHHIRNKQVLTGIRYADLRECARQQRILASDWLFPQANANIPKPPPPLIPPVVAERFIVSEPPPILTGKRINGNEIVSPTAPVPVPTRKPETNGHVKSADVVRPVEPPAPPPAVPSPTVGESSDAGKYQKNQLNHAERYHVTSWIATQRDFIVKSRWNIGNLLAALQKAFPKYTITETNVRASAKVVGIKLAKTPGPTREPKPKKEPVSPGDLEAFGKLVATVLDKFAAFDKRLAYLETQLGVQPPSQPEQVT